VWGIIIFHHKSYKLELEALNFDFWVVSVVSSSFFYHSKHSHQLALQRHQAEGPRLVVGEEQPGRNLLDDLTHLATSEDHLTGGTIIGLVTLWSFNNIKIVDLPSYKMVVFHSYVKVYQREMFRNNHWFSKC
jgi:hypothetical protein